jgi:dienelactone hydrolase
MLSSTGIISVEVAGLIGTAHRERWIAPAAENRSTSTILLRLTFKAAVAYYPECGHVSDKLALPVLIMIGRDDQWVRARSCEELLAHRTGGGAPIYLTVYPDVRHSFLEPDYMAEYDEPAAEDSLRQARAFLARNLGGSR